MYTSFFIAKNNMKKKKSDVAVIALLITLATMLLYISISVLGNMEEVIDNAAQACNTSDHVYYTSDEGAALAKEIWDELDEAEIYEISPVLYSPSVKYYGENSKEEKEYVFILSALGEDRTINKMNIGEHGEEKENSIVLPYSMQISEGYEIGDKFFMEIDGEQYEFEVMGFAEDPLFATTLNISMYRCYIPQEIFQHIICTENGKKMQYNECRVLLKDNVDAYEYTEIFIDKLAGRNDESIVGLIYESMKGGLMMMPNICMGITLVFSVILITIAIIIIRFSVKNFIEENLKNIGILQACGYTSCQLRNATLIEMGIMGIIGCILGLMLSVCGEGIVGNIQANLVGLHYNVGFDFKYGLISFAIVLLIVCFITYISSRTYKKLNVLDALRGGIHTHNFKKNVIPLHKTRLSVNTAIGMKNILGAKLKNMGILLVVAILSFACCVGFSLYENFARNTDNLLKIVGGELGTAVVFAENVDEMGEEIASWEEVEKVNYYNCTDVNVTSGDKSKSITSDVWKNPELIENIVILDGRVPKYDNEVVISTMVRDFLGVKTGDIIYLQGENENLPYVVSGITQMINNGGWKMMLNYEGVKRLNGNEKTTQFYIYAKEGYDFKDIKAKMDEYYPDIQLTESEKLAEGALGVVGTAMEMLCVLFVIITIVVVFLVVFLLIRTKIISDRKNNGVFKALGYTTKNLMVQTVMSNLPVIFVGAVLGAIISIFAMSPLTTACLSFCGVEKCDMAMAPIYLILTVIGITLVAFLVSMAISTKIRKVEPVKLLTEE